MKTPLFLVLLCAAPSAPALTAPVLAQTEAIAKSWNGVAKLKTLSKKEKTRELSAIYPIFRDDRPVAQLAESVLKRAALDGFSGFEKDSRGSAKKLGLSDGMFYSYSFDTALMLHRPRFIAATTMISTFTGGAHGLFGTDAYNFGYPDGQTRPRQLKLADFFSDGAGAYPRINKLLMAKLRATRSREKEASFVVDGTVKLLDNDSLDNFVAEEDGLRWYFAPYLVGPYAAGEFEVKLSARELGPKFRATLVN